MENRECLNIKHTFQPAVFIEDVIKQKAENLSGYFTPEAIIRWLNES